MLGTFLTVLATKFDFGMFNVGVALLIAIVKASLVLTFFMHLKDSARIVTVAAVGGFLFLLLMIVFLLTDLYSRGWVGAAQGWGV